MSRVAAGDPQCGEEQTGQHIGRVVLAPVHARRRDEDGEGNRREQEQPPPPATRMPDDQDRQPDVQAARCRLVA